MIFLIEYQPATGRLLRLDKFADSQRAKAEQARLELELRLLGKIGVDHEVVLLEADDEAVLRKTHRRYFEDLAGLATVNDA